MLSHRNITCHPGSKQLLNTVQFLYHTIWQAAIQHEITKDTMSLYGKVRIKPQYLECNNKHNCTMLMIMYSGTTLKMDTIGEVTSICYVVVLHSGVFKYYKVINLTHS